MSKISSNPVSSSWSGQTQAQSQTHADSKLVNKRSDQKIDEQKSMQQSAVIKENSGIPEFMTESRVSAQSDLNQSLKLDSHKLDSHAKVVIDTEPVYSELTNAGKPTNTLSKVPHLLKPQTPDGNKTIHQLATLIEKSIIGLSTDDLTSRLQSINQAETTTTSLVETWQKNSQDSLISKKLHQASQWNARLSGFTGAIISVGVASIATVASSGTALPLLICASAALASSSITLADEISQSSGGEEISLSRIFTHSASNLLEKIGADKSQADSWGNLVGGAVGIATGAVIMDSKMAGKTAKGLSQISGFEISNQTENLISQAAGISVSVALFGLTRPLGNWPATAGQTAVTANQLGKVAKAASQLGQIVYKQAARHFNGVNADTLKSAAADAPVPNILNAALNQTYLDINKMFNLIDSGRHRVMALFEQKISINRHISNTNHISNLIA